MNEHREPLDRIAAALERMAPPELGAPDWLGFPAYLWNGVQAQPINAIDALPLTQLRGIDDQKSALIANLDRLASGAAAHDMLLWGARGMGKSALVRCAVAAQQKAGSGRLALIQVSANAIADVPALIEELSGIGRAFVLFFDDLGFGGDQTQDNLALRSLLDGGLISRPPHVRLAVTSNRRAIVERDGKESESFHERDERDNSLALADRFGLALGFHPCDLATYLEIVEAYLSPIALGFAEKEAAAWAIDRGNRSGRTAYQFACEIAGRAGVPL